MLKRELTVAQKVLFSTGDLSTSLTLAIQTFFQLYFLTDVARIPPSSAAWIVGITRLWDAINDPLIGFYSDRVRSKFGRRRVLLVYGSIPLGVAFAVCWLVPPWSQAYQNIYYTLAIIAFDTTFTIVHIGYNALTPNMTQDYDQRSSLNGYRMVCSLGGTLMAIVFATVLAEVVEERTRFAILGLTLGAIAIIPPWIVFAVSDEADKRENVSEMGFGKALATTLSNRAFLFLAVLFLLSWTAVSVLAAMLIYFANNCLQVPDQSSYFLLTAQAAAVISVPLIVWLAGKLDKQLAYLIGTTYWCMVLIAFFLIPDAEVFLAYLTAMLCGPGIATAAVVPWAMLPDVIEFEEKNTGERREGSYYALVSFFQKLGTGTALWGIALVLAASGYVPPEGIDELPTQPESARRAIRLIIGPVTICLLLISLPFAWWYPINRKLHAQTLNELDRN